MTTNDNQASGIERLRQTQKAHKAFAILAAQGRLGTRSDVKKLTDELEYGQKILDQLAQLVGRRTFSHTTGLILRTMLLEYALYLP